MDEKKQRKINCCITSAKYLLGFALIGSLISILGTVAVWMVVSFVEMDWWEFDKRNWLSARVWVMSLFILGAMIGFRLSLDANSGKWEDE